MQVIDVEHLSYAVRPHFFSKPRPLLQDVSFSVCAGEIFGFLGPNGAGKTTTIKMLLNLLTPDQGQVRLQGAPCADPKARASVGFLPERAFYPAHLSGYEFVLSHALLAGLSWTRAKQRSALVLEQTGVGAAAHRRLGTYSKGMLQRTGLAQAIVGDPAVVILDEPMSGLDPLGRRDVRDIMQALRQAGKTVFFSTHILPDVELICDKVAILVGGKLRRTGPLPQLIAGLARGIEVSLAPCTPAQITELSALCQAHRPHASGHSFEVQSLTEANALIDCARAQSITITQLQAGHGGLEQLFVSEATP